MTTIKQDIKAKGIKREAREIREAGEKAAASKNSARRFLIATGVYTASGELKPAFR